jgi:16S rRNA (guanine527-N7)-methyltransferase
MSADGSDTAPDDGMDGLAALVDGAAALGAPLDTEQVRRFACYRDLLLDWNTRVNLTAITDPTDVATKHFLDSLTCLLAPVSAPAGQAPHLLDVGAGAGFPGLPLAIARPGWRVTLLEATGKKVRFLEAAIAELGLTNARAITGRAEELAHHADHRGRYDVVTARAVAALPTLLEYCCPFVRVGGHAVSPKKGDLAAETAAGARAAAQLGARLLSPIPVTLPALADGRVLLVVRQEHPCPPQYPRSAGAPAKRPLR